jgi:8-oxo-dGTP pyrophosphatase MutT (NUDIX family)
MSVWMLPGGGLELGESIAEAVLREVQEETDVQIRISRPFGLYFWHGFDQLSIVIGAVVEGGILAEYSSEALTNQFFTANELPKLRRAEPILDAVRGGTLEPRTLRFTPHEARLIKWQLHAYHFGQWLLRRPSRRDAVFDVQAVAVLWDKQERRILTVDGMQMPLLPRVVCGVDQAPWDRLTDYLTRRIGVTPQLQWSGLRHDVRRRKIELVFTGLVNAPDHPNSGTAAWAVARNLALPPEEMGFVDRARPIRGPESLWMQIDDDQAGSIINLKKGN